MSSRSTFCGATSSSEPTGSTGLGTIVQHRARHSRLRRPDLDRKRHPDPRRSAQDAAPPAAPNRRPRASPVLLRPRRSAESRPAPAAAQPQPRRGSRRCAAGVPSDGGREVQGVLRGQRGGRHGERRPVPGRRWRTPFGHRRPDRAARRQARSAPVRRSTRRPAQAQGQAPARRARKHPLRAHALPCPPGSWGSPTSTSPCPA